MQSALVHTDAIGRRWRAVGPVVYHDGPSGEFKPAARPPSPPIESLSLEEATKILRPKTEIGGVEYTMSDDDAREFAATIQEVARTRRSGSARGSHARPAQASSSNADGVATIQQKIITGNVDDRFNINASAGGPPYDNHGQLLNCTCFKLLNHHTCVTAAHCHHTGAVWKQRFDITFRAGSGAPLPSVPKECYARTVPGSWTTGQGHDNDYAVLALRGHLGAWCPQNTYDVGYLGWHTISTGANPLFVIISGYPSSGLPWGWIYPTLSYEIRWDGYQPSNFPGQIHYWNDTTSGQSGTPVMNNDWSVMGIHSGSNAVLNIGVRLTPSLITTLTSWAGF